MGVVNEVSQGNHYASHIALTQICIFLAIFLAHTALTHICIFLTHILFHILAKEIIMRHICSYTYLHFSLANGESHPMQGYAPTILEMKNAHVQPTPPSV